MGEKGEILVLLTRCECEVVAFNDFNVPLHTCFMTELQISWSSGSHTEQMKREMAVWGDLPHFISHESCVTTAIFLSFAVSETKP